MVNPIERSNKVTEAELIALANSLDVVLNPRDYEMNKESIDRFGHLVSLLKKITQQVYG